MRSTVYDTERETRSNTFDADAAVGTVRAECARADNDSASRTKPLVGAGGGSAAHRGSEEDCFSRTKLLIGESGVAALRKSRVIVFGIGGVGGFVVEALSRAGIGALDIVDNDTVSASNINRQLFALHSTIGAYKVDVASARIRDINPECTVTAHGCFFLPDTADRFDFSRWDYVVDAVDTVAAKIEIIKRAKEAGTRIVSSMGTGNKLDASRFRIGDIAETSVCPLARVVRRELKKRGIENVPVLYSTELPSIRSAVPASISFVPAAAGLLIAQKVVHDLLEKA